MITLKEIRTGAAETLRKLFPKARVYKNEVIEGFSAPCFFVSAFFNSIRAANKETVFVEATVEIPFFSSKEPLQRVRDEDEAYKVMGMLSAAFASKLKVSDRYLNITDNSFAWSGENSDIPTFQLVLEYFDDCKTAGGESTGAQLIDNIEISEGVK